MKLGGLQEISLLDYPDKVCAIVWTVGCNFRCPFCYNPDMVYGTSELVPVDHVYCFLDKRNGKLDAISITGGEPLLYEDITEFIQTVKDKGFLIKLDTNGTFPDRLDRLLDAHLIDYVSMDIKAPKEKYELLAGSPVDIDVISKSIKLIMKKAPDYEFKTTMVPSLLDKKDVEAISLWIKDAKRYYLQQFKSDVKVIDQKLLSSVEPFEKKDFEEMKEIASLNVKECIVRGI